MKTGLHVRIRHFLQHASRHRPRLSTLTLASVMAAFAPSFTANATPLPQSSMTEPATTTAETTTSVTAGDPFNYNPNRNNGSGADHWFVTNELTTPLGDQPDPGDYVGYGEAVAVDGDWMVIGAPQRLRPNGDIAGSAFFYLRQGGSWVLTQRLLFTGSIRSYCGHAVALRGRFAVIGCPGFDGGGLEGRGRTIIYARNEAGVFTQETVLPGMATRDHCGTSVAIHGTGAVGETFVATGCIERREPTNQVQTGGVDVYRLATAAAGQAPTWALDAALLPVADDIWDWSSAHLGSSVAVHRHVNGLVSVAAGSTGYQDQDGAVQVFVRNATGEWSMEKLFERPNGVMYGHAVALDGVHLAIGHPLSNQVHAYTRSSGLWTSTPVVLTPPPDTPNLANGQDFGHSISMNNGVLWVGSWAWPLSELRSGYAWAFRRTGSGAFGQAPLAYTAVQGVQPWDPNSFLGSSLAMDDQGTVVIGAPGQAAAVDGESRGRAFVMRNDGIFGNGFQ